MEFKFQTQTRAERFYVYDILECIHDSTVSQDR